MNNLLKALRHSTANTHQALHEHPILQACQERRLDHSGYVHMLKAFYTPWRHLMSGIDLIPILALQPYLEKRYQAIRSDLESLDVNKDFLNLDISDVIDKNTLLGMSYVLLGSSMGAKQLRNNLLATLDNVPVSYLSMSPKDAGWFILVDHLQKMSLVDYPGADSAALYTFQVIEQELSRVIR